MAAFALATFALLLAANTGLGDGVSDASRARDVLTSAHRLENVLFDLAGFVLTRNQRFLRSYAAARAAFAGQAANLQRVSAADGERRSVAAGHEARITAVAIAAGLLGLIAFVTYLTRTVIHPVRRTCVLAGLAAQEQRALPPHR